MTLTNWVSEVLTVFGGLPAEALLSIAGTGIIGAAAFMYRRLVRSGR